MSFRDVLWQLCRGLVVVGCANTIVLGSGLDEAAVDLRPELVSTSQRNVTVRWEVLAAREDLRLRLYGGSSVGDLHLVYEAATQRGVRSFATDDVLPEASSWMYQLRFVTEQGREVVLKTVLCVAPDLTAGQGAGSTVGLERGIACGELWWAPRAGHRVWCRQMPQQGLFRPAPESPPPELM